MMKLTDVAFAAWLVMAGVGLWGCAGGPSAAQQLPAPPTDPNQVVAEVGGRTAYPWLARILVVDVPREVQRERLMARLRAS